MSIFEYNQEEHIRMEREEAKKEALTNAPFKENRVTPRKCVLLGANIFGGVTFQKGFEIYGALHPLIRVFLDFLPLS